jgi:hypothetical protein
MITIFGAVDRFLGDFVSFWAKLHMRISVKISIFLKLFFCENVSKITTLLFRFDGKLFGRNVEKLNGHLVESLPSLSSPSSSEELWLRRRFLDDVTATSSKLFRLDLCYATSPYMVSAGAVVSTFVSAYPTIAL